MSFYLDANILVSLFVTDSHSAAADRWIDSAPGVIAVSDLAKVEFAAVMSRMVRMGAMHEDAARETLADCDAWLAAATQLARLQSHDMEFADQLVRDFATQLAGPDALHLAIASNHGHTLVTFDQRLANAARMRGVQIVEPG